jgi:hypothetical protein
MSHYQDGIETIEIIRQKTNLSEFKGFCKGNVIKYITRAGKKKGSKEKDDYKKALYYCKCLADLESSDDEVAVVQTPEPIVIKEQILETPPAKVLFKCMHGIYDYNVKSDKPTCPQCINEWKCRIKCHIHDKPDNFCGYCSGSLVIQKPKITEIPKETPITVKGKDIEKMLKAVNSYPTYNGPRHEGKGVTGRTF